MQHGRILKMRLGIDEMLHWDQKTPRGVIVCSTYAIHEGDTPRRISSPPRSEAQCDDSRMGPPGIDDPANRVWHQQIKSASAGVDPDREALESTISESDIRGRL
jgi:hypothetical protein